MTHKSNGKPRHTNVLKPSQPDDIGLATAVEVKFLTICNLYKTTHGMNLPIPESLMPDMKRWRQIRVRHKQGDHRHTEAEMLSTKVIAQWTVDVNAKLRGQKEGEQIEWK
jgi:hypothetical protein